MYQFGFKACDSDSTGQCTNLLKNVVLSDLNILVMHCRAADIYHWNVWTVDEKVVQSLILYYWIIIQDATAYLLEKVNFKV